VSGTGDGSHDGVRYRVYEIIFEADTGAGKAFDLALIVAIVASVLVVMIESVAAYRIEYGEFLRIAEWVFTIAFTIEYVLRLACVGRPVAYATSFFGIIDLLAVLPTFLSLLLPGAQFMLVIRLLRILRVFRVLKLARFTKASSSLLVSLRASRHKIAVFVFAVLTLVVVLGSLMYLVEGGEHGFTSIPRSVYWAIVTLTTVGYGDVVPHTPLGQALAACIMIMGYGIIAVPTGIVTAELVRGERPDDAHDSRHACRQCTAEGHRVDAVHCYRCGESIE